MDDRKIINGIFEWKPSNKLTQKTWALAFWLALW